MADQEEDQGITAYHGSPHEFEQFDLSKIGTGEGAQAYGHGMYFAEREPVAKEYRDRLAREEPSQGGTMADAFSLSPEQYGMMDEEDMAAHVEDIQNNAVNTIFEKGVMKHVFDDGSALIDDMSKMAPVKKAQGHMYEVSINAHPNHFLDWDKPLSEQSEHVKNAVINHAKLSGFEHYTPQGENAPVVLNQGISGDTAGHNLYKWFGNDNSEQASKMLNFYGIKGIKYLDAGSRGKSENPTRNYVVFDDKLVNVKRRYAQGGRIGYDDGGSPSIGQRISEYAETLPTAEENIETVKQFGRNVGESALDFGKRIYSGFEKMAERALERPPAPTVRAGERPVYAEPKREAPPQRLYVLPDGRRVSGAELEMHNEMMRERFEEQHAMPRVVQENMPLPNRPSPTRAPFREKLQRQEQQANVDRPVVLPEREGFKWPQVYKDIMSPEPQMEWTKGMTPREQDAPVKTAEGSIFSSRGSDGRESGIQMGGGSNASGPLEVSVTKTITGPKDVYLGTGDTPNPFHFHQTMVAPAPEYEGQVVPIPDTPADRMGEYHLSKLIWPLHQLKSKEGYKAKQGLEDYNPPMSATGERFPNQEDVNFYRDVDAYYGRPEAGYLQQGARGSYYDDLTKMVDRQGGYRRTMTPQESDAFKAAYIAAQRNPIAALGFRPEEFDFSGSPIPQTTAGSVLGTSTRIYADLKFPSVAVHEAIHRGLMEIENEDYNAYKAKIDSLLKEMNDLTKQRYSPEMQNRIFQISNELDRLHENKTDPDIFPPGQIGDPEEKVDEQELFVRSLMYKMFGPVEGYELERQLIKGGVIEEYPPEKLERFMINNADRINRLEQRALKMLQERQREGGPRASGGRVRDKYAVGGNPGDLAGGGFGTGNIGGGSSISSGGTMAEARAADRESVSGYSASGGGGGRDNYSSIGRSINGGQDFGFDRADRMSPMGLGIQGGVLLGGVTPSGYGRSQSQQSMLQSMGIEGPADTSGLPTALRPGGNIGAALTKEILTPNFSTANSPLASGIESYDQNAINALYDRMREEQQAARDAAYQRSVIGPVTKDINVPNAGDLYGATNAPLAVNQQPSGMFGQPKFGTTKFGEAPRQSGFPQMQSQTRSLEDVMGTKPQGEYLFSGMDISQRAVPNTYSVDPNSVIQQVRKEWPNMTRAMNDQDIQNAILGGLPEGVSYKNGVLTGNINDPSLQATLQKGGVSMQTFKPVTETSATTQWGQPQAGPYRSVSMDGVAPQDFAGMYPVSSRMTPAETAAEISRSVVGFPSMADKPLQVPSQATQQTARENFNSAFAAARSQGKTTFTWTNPATGQTSTYTTQLERKNGGRVPSMSEPDEWLAEKNESKKPERRAIAKRSVMLSSSKS